MYLISIFIFAIVLLVSGEGRAADSFTYIPLNRMSVAGSYQAVALGDAGETTYLYLSRRDSQGQILRWNGKSAEPVHTKTAYEQTGAEAGAAWADFDGDGDQDLYVSRFQQPNLLFRNEGKDRFMEVAADQGLADEGSGQGVSWVDYDGDGDLDLYVVNYGMPNQLYKNDAGRFMPVQLGVDHPGRGLSAAWADYDDDGDQDMYLVNFGQANQLYENGGGRFSEVSKARGAADSGPGVSASWVDYDGDGDWDLSLAQVGRPNKLLPYDKKEKRFGKDVARSLVLADRGQSQMLAWGDYDRDGDLDVYVVNGGDESPDLSRLYRNDGKRFTNTTTQNGLSKGKGGGAKKSKGAIWWDMDTDGDLDLFVVHSGQENSAYRNEGIGEGFHGVAVQLQSQRPDRNLNGVGSVVHLWSGGKRQIRQVGTTGNALSQGSQRPFFGLGKGSIDSMLVVWPDGNAQALTPKVSNILKVKKGRPKLVLKPRSLDFSIIPVNESGFLTFTIANEGNADLKIIRVSLDQVSKIHNFLVPGIQLINPASPLKVAPGQSTTMQVEYSPILEGLGALTMVIFESNAGMARIEVRGEGGAPGRLVIEPNEIYVHPDNPKTSIRLKNTGGGSINITGYEVVNQNNKARIGNYRIPELDRNKKITFVENKMLEVQAKPRHQVPISQVMGILYIYYGDNQRATAKITYETLDKGLDKRRMGLLYSPNLWGGILTFAGGAYKSYTANSNIDKYTDKYRKSRIPQKTPIYWDKAESAQNSRTLGLAATGIGSLLLGYEIYKKLYSQKNNNVSFISSKGIIPSIGWNRQSGTLSFMIYREIL